MKSRSQRIIVDFMITVALFILAVYVVHYASPKIKSVSSKPGKIIDTLAIVDGDTIFQYGDTINHNQ